MSGHSKWSQIRLKKALTDKKKGQIFSKISKLITIAARKGTDPKSNPSLAGAIEKAREVNMPKDNIERAVRKTSDKSLSLEEIIIEALGPAGVAIKIKGITDNKNRTIAEIKKILGDHNSKMAQPGSLTWMFQTPVAINDENSLKDLDALLEALDDNDDVDDITTNLSQNDDNIGN
jgi:YebC/PmpR family DNA-binding regulatory protein